MPSKDAPAAQQLIAKSLAAAQDPAAASGACLVPRRPDPCALVIFGASGDLTARMLLPALFRLFRGGGLPEQVTITGAARTAMSDDAFREHVRQALESSGDLDPAAWNALAPRLSYQPLEYDDPAAYDALAERLRSHDADHGTRGNRVFYLATPPTVYEDVARRLGAAGLATEHGRDFSRIVVEKPFGRDLDTARALDAALHEHFAEHQIFRIDHYLAKETVQNILMFRFANAIFEPVWNRQYVASVTCASTESLGVEHRAGYYEHSGVLRDMFQNHMMQLLSLVAIEPPSHFEAEPVRDEKTKVYRSLRPFDPARIDQDLVLGQYAPGTVHGRPVPGYRDEPGTAPDSTTPTFAMMRLWIDNWRWQGVPFLITSGKRLREKLTRIVVTFREVPHSMFRNILGQDISPNRLVMDIAPDSALSLTFQSKLPGPHVCLQPVTMRFDFNAQRSLGAYEKVLLDCMLGDQMLFWRQDAVELCWGFLTPILQQCETCTTPPTLHPYPSGTWGPPASLDLMHTLF